MKAKEWIWYEEEDNIDGDGNDVGNEQEGKKKKKLRGKLKKKYIK